MRAFFKGKIGNNKAHGDPFGFETFSSKGFITFTGQRLDTTELLGTENVVADLTDDVRALCSMRFKGWQPTDETFDDPLMSYEPRLGLSSVQIDDALDPDMGHNYWLHVGMALHHETDGEGFGHWNAWSAKGSKYSGEDVLQKRWDSFGGMTGRPVTARSLVKLAHENGAYLNVDVASITEFEAIGRRNR